MAVKLSDLVKTYESVEKSGDFSEWCDKLELVAELQKVKDLHSFLPLFLSGPAFAVYKQMAPTVKADFKALKKELTNAFGVDSFSAYQQLQTRVYVAGETVDVYLADLKRLVELIGQEDAEPLLKCAFVAGLPTDVAVQLKAIVAVEKLSLNELVARARMILTTVHGGVTSCAVGVVKTRDVQCFSCSGRGHVSRDCPTRLKSGKKFVRCYTCHAAGHISKNCPQKGNETGSTLASDVLPNPSQ